MVSIKNLVYVVAGAFGISVLGGMFNWNFSDEFTILLGAVDVIAIVWLVVLVSQKDYKSNK